MYKIDDKILKLLALINSPNDNEASSAFQLLRRRIDIEKIEWQGFIEQLREPSIVTSIAPSKPFSWREPSEEEVAKQQAYSDALEQSCKRRGIDVSKLFRCSYEDDAWLLSDDLIVIERQRAAEEMRQRQDELRRRNEQAKHTANEAEQKRREKEAHDRLTKIEAAKARGKRIGQREASELAKDLRQEPLLQSAIFVFQNRTRLCATDREAIEKIYLQVANCRYGSPSEQRAFRKAIASEDAATIERLNDCLRQTLSTRIY